MATLVVCMLNTVVVISRDVWTGSMSQIVSEARRPVCSLRLSCPPCFIWGEAHHRHISVSIDDSP